MPRLKITSSESSTEIQGQVDAWADLKNASCSIAIMVHDYAPRLDIVNNDNSAEIRGQVDAWARTKAAELAARAGAKALV
jgi:hypothetical protein